MKKYTIYRERYEFRGVDHELSLDELVEAYLSQTWFYPEVIAAFRSEDEAKDALAKERCTQWVKDAYPKGKLLTGDVVYMAEEDWDGDDIDQDLGRVFAELR